MNSMQRSAEQGLRESEERFRVTFEQAAVGIAHVAPDGRFLRVNDKLCDISGYSRNELLRLRFTELALPEELANGEEARRSMVAGERRSFSIERRYRRKNGEVFWAGLVTTLLRESTGEPKYFISVIEDITPRKRAEQALQESEERFSGAFEHAPIGVALVSTDGRWLKVNRALCALVGYSEAELLTRTFQDITHPEDLEVDLENVRRTIAGEIGSYQMEKRYVHGRGHSVTVLLNVSLVRDDQGLPRYFISQIQDISERKRAETALRMSEAEFRTLAEAMPQIVWVTRPDGGNVYFNQKWMDYTGLTLEESVGHEWNAPFHPDDRQRARDAWRQATATICSYSLECRLRRADGIYRWWLIRGAPQLDATGNILKWFGTCTDIHDLKLAELEISRANRALREAEAKYRSIFENSNEGIFQTTLDGRYISANPALARMLGFASPEELIRERTDIGSQGYVDSALRATFKRALEERDFINGFEYEAPCKDGSRIWISENARIVRDAAGNAAYYEGSLQDITKRKLSEANLEKTHKELLAASRRAGMAEVATSVLHNVGNVLNSVNVASSCLADSLRRSKAASLSKVVTMLREHEKDLGAFLSSDPKGKQLPGYLAQLAEHLAGEQASALNELAQLQKNIEHIKQIVAMQQSYAKVSGVTETTKVADLVEDALRMNAGALSGHELEIIREYGEVPPVTIDKHKVLQILVNLVRNAMHACQESDRADKRLTMRAANGDGLVKISVIDNGIGIPPENLTRIFNHGFTTRKDGHGFGLHSGALAAKEMGGSLSAQSAGADQGATFTLELPLVSSKVAHG